MNILDIGIILVLIAGALVGFKRGVIRSTISLVGTILVIILSFYLKNPVGAFLYTNMPFFKIGLLALNIIIYEVIAFLIVFSILSVILRIIIKVSGIIDKVLNITLVLALPSKIIGALVTFIEYYLFVFIALFMLKGIGVTSSLFEGSNLANKILTNTPVISDMVTDKYKAIDELISIEKKNHENKREANEEAMDVLLKYNILSKKNADDLNDKQKFEFDYEEVLNNYNEGEWLYD